MSAPNTHAVEVVKTALAANAAGFHSWLDRMVQADQRGDEAAGDECEAHARYQEARLAVNVRLYLRLVAQ